MRQVDANPEIAGSGRSSTADTLSQLLADGYNLYLKTHNYHWNVTGPYFGALHALPETQYTGLALAVDAVAERIRALGHRAPGSYAEFPARTEVVEATMEPTRAMELVAALTTDGKHVLQPAEGHCRIARRSIRCNAGDLYTDLGDPHARAADEEHRHHQ